MSMFVLAASDHLMALKLCLVCRAALSCMLPELYRNVTLTSANQIVAFHRTLSRSARPGSFAANHRLPPMIHNLWLGPNSCSETQRLSYASASWPIEAIHDIFTVCLNLRSLAMVNLDQSMWVRLEHVIPTTVENLYLGPVHGSISLKSMRCFSRLHSLISANTYMSDWEVRDIVTSPHCRRFCRFFQWLVHVEFAFRQFQCIIDTPKLDNIQIIVFGQGNFEKNVQKMVSEYSQVLKDKRVSVMCVPASDSDWMEILYCQWNSEV